MLMREPERICPKHKIKMTCLFSSYVCDDCNPPKSVVSKKPIQERYGFKPGDKIRVKVTDRFYEGVVDARMFEDNFVQQYKNRGLSQSEQIISIDLSPSKYGKCGEYYHRISLVK